jgi:hypothetical protein
LPYSEQGLPEGALFTKDILLVSMQKKRSGNHQALRPEAKKKKEPLARLLYIL